MPRSANRGPRQNWNTFLHTVPKHQQKRFAEYATRTGLTSPQEAARELIEVGLGAVPESSIVYARSMEAASRIRSEALSRIVRALTQVIADLESEVR